MQKRHNIYIDEQLCQFVEEEALCNTTISKDAFWQALSNAVEQFMPKNRALLEKRRTLQKSLDNFYKQHKGQDVSTATQEEFLKDIGYLVEEGAKFTVNPKHVDVEISHTPGPQLVVPVKNTRFCVNAVNSRYVSLFDALYVTDFLPHEEASSKDDYIAKRQQAVLTKSFAICDDLFALSDNVSHADVKRYTVEGQRLVAHHAKGRVFLQDEGQFIGHQGSIDAPTALIIKRHHLHIILEIDANHPIGKLTKTGLKDMMVEAAITTIQDFEDSVAAVDAPDKIEVYRNWLHLMQGTCAAVYTSNGKERTRVMHDDMAYIDTQNKTAILRKRSLMFMRHVGLHMMCDMVQDAEGNAVGEGIIDAFIGVLGALHNRQDTVMRKNSLHGSIYVVKPKLHGPEEVAFAQDILAFVEQALGLAPNTIKIGLMDEEKRTTLNLKECIRVIKDRVVFINTGFLDRTASEIAAINESGVIVPKSQMKKQQWFSAYENWNVDIGLECGLYQKGQIGKGMWAKPAKMHDMYKEKVAELHAGATCAWVPSPQAAAIHALHYLYHDVFAIQQKLKSRTKENKQHLLALPTITAPLDNAVILHELKDNIQSILGYTLKWIEQGIGCSTVPNMDNVGLMEDRATLRISSQILANWLHHNVCDEAQMQTIFEEMAVLVDAQHKNDNTLQALQGNKASSYAYQASYDLATKGGQQDDGYTEFILAHYRVLCKQQQVRAN